VRFQAYAPVIMQNFFPDVIPCNLVDVYLLPRENTVSTFRVKELIG
jgi:hypothetical protein